MIWMSDECDDVGETGGGLGFLLGGRTGEEDGKGSDGNFDGEEEKVGANGFDPFVREEGTEPVMRASKSAPELDGPGPSIRGFFLSMAGSSSGARFVVAAVVRMAGPFAWVLPGRDGTRTSGAETSALAPRGRRVGSGVGRRPFGMGWWMCRERVVGCSEGG